MSPTYVEAQIYGDGYTETVRGMLDGTMVIDGTDPDTVRATLTLRDIRITRLKDGSSS